MIVDIPGRGLLTEEESTHLLMALLEDDTEDAPWMVMGSLQFTATAKFFESLQDYAERLQLPWFVTGMTPILYLWSGVPRKRQLSPDVFVAIASDRPRTSFDVEAEGEFPAFVLEVVSPSSSDRDHINKRVAYDQLGAREYALFTPFVDRPPELVGYRRSAAGRFEPWPADDQGRLWSEVLELYLLAQGATIRAATRDGDVLPSISEFRQENERLRREIEDLRRQAKG